MKSLITAALMLSAAVPGLAPAQEVSILPYPLPVQRYSELMQYLGLTEAQATQLQTIATARNQAQQALYEQIGEKYRQIQALLNANTNDAAMVGRLTIEVNNLQKQRIPTEPWRSQALNVLNAAQKQKLPTLQQAQQLQTPGWQAGALNLIDSPNQPHPAAVGDLSTVSGPAGSPVAEGGN